MPIAKQAEKSAQTALKSQGFDMAYSTFETELLVTDILKCKAKREETGNSTGHLLLSMVKHF